MLRELTAVLHGGHRVLAVGEDKAITTFTAGLPDGLAPRVEAVPHRELLQAVWGPDYGDQVDYLRVIIRNLRKKIESDPDHPVLVSTEPWVGYRFNGTLEPF